VRARWFPRRRRGPKCPDHTSPASKRDCSWISVVTILSLSLPPRPVSANGRAAASRPRTICHSRIPPNRDCGVDLTFENQSFRASGLSLLTAAIVHWNTIYLDPAVQHLRAQGVSVPDELLAHVVPLGWEHIALTGDYDWNTARPVQGLRPLRAVPEAFTLRAA
jgi:hypothetical protein